MAIVIVKFNGGPLDGATRSQVELPQLMYFHNPYDIDTFTITPKIGSAIYKLMGKSYFFIGYVPGKKK